MTTNPPHNGKTDDLDDNDILPIDVRVSLKLNQVYNKCLSNRLEFNLSFKRLKQMMLQKTCYYTRVKFQRSVPILRRSIDRVDSTKGYTDDNVVACTAFINSMKKNLSYEQIKDLYKGVTKFRKTQTKPKKTKLVILKNTDELHRSRRVSL